MDDMYMKARLALPINSNVGMVFPRQHFPDEDAQLRFKSLKLEHEQTSTVHPDPSGNVHTSIDRPVNPYRAYILRHIYDRKWSLP